MFSKGCPVTSHPPFPSVCFQMSFRSQGSIGSISVIRGIVGGVKFEMQNKILTLCLCLGKLVQQ